MDIRIENLSYFCFRKIRWSLRMIMGMKKLLSLPPNLVDCFHAVEHVSTEEWFCTSDPVGARLGSGGGTTWLLEASRRKEAPDVSTEEWLGQEKRILLHADRTKPSLPENELRPLCCFSIYFFSLPFSHYYFSVT